MFCYFHRPVPENYGVWDQLQIDRGSEFTLISKMQEFYSEFRNDKTRVPVRVTNHLVFKENYVKVKNTGCIHIFS